MNVIIIKNIQKEKNSTFIPSNLSIGSNNVTRTNKKNKTVTNLLDVTEESLIINFKKFSFENQNNTYQKDNS